MKDVLDKMFRHNTWYQGANLTWKEFLELAAESNSFYLTEVFSKKQSENLLDERSYDIVLKSEEDRGFVRLTQEQIRYYKEREVFWREWHDNFTKERYHKHFTTKELHDYYARQRTEKEKIPEYKVAFSKILGRCNK